MDDSTQGNLVEHDKERNIARGGIARLGAAGGDWLNQQHLLLVLGPR